MTGNQRVAFLVGSLLMLPIFFGRDWVPGNDSYYHLTMARYPWALAAADAFPWLHWTLFREQFVNHHMGFQFLLAPWVWAADGLTGNPALGGQVAALLCAGLTSLGVYRILVLRGVPAPLVWTLLLGVLPWQFWMRMGYTRAPMIALPMMLFAVELFFRGKPVWLAVWAALFVLIYFGAVLFAVLIAALIAGWVLVEGIRREPLKLGLFAAAGLAIGFVVHPSFPENIGFMRVQLFDSGLSAAADIGNEWKPPPAWTAMKMWLPLLLLWWLAMATALRRGTRIDAGGMGLFVLAVVFLILSAKMRRMVEYAPVFVLLSAADLFRGWEVAERWRPLRRVVITAVVLAVAWTGPGLARRHTGPPHDLSTVVTAMQWLRETTPVNSLVFTDDWDDFPILFYHNRHNRYVVGLDPMFTARPYPEHWRRYKHITRGEAALHRSGDGHESSLDDIRDVFLADYVLVRRDHPALYRQLIQAQDRFELRYPADGHGGDIPPISIFQVRANRAVEAAEIP